MQDHAGFTKSVALCAEGEMPYLELSSAHPSRQAPYCVRLKASDADQPLDVVTQLKLPITKKMIGQYTGGMQEK